MVARVFEWYVQGVGKGTIASRLNGLGLPNPTAYKAGKGSRYRRPGPANDGLWTPATVARMLQNPVYAGTLVQGRQRVVSYKVHQTMAVPPEDWYVVEGTHVPLVPRPCSSGPRNWPSGRPAGRRDRGRCTCLPASCGARTAANP